MTTRKPSMALLGLVGVLLLAVLFAVVALAAPHLGAESDPAEAPGGIEVDVDLDRHKATPRKTPGQASARATARPRSTSR